MAISIDQTRRVQVIEHPTLLNFNKEFGTESDLSRYENFRSNQRVTSPSVAYLNELQMNFFIPSRTVLLLKNNLHDDAFILYTTRSVLYQLKQNGKIGEGCFNFLHGKLNTGDFLSVYRYLYIINLYSKIAQNHDANISDAAFRFESLAHYSDKLVKTPSHIVSIEEKTLQHQSRQQFMKQWLIEITGRPNCPREAQQQIFTLINAVESSNAVQFRIGFLDLLEKLQKTSELEKICWEELRSSLTPFNESNFFEQTYLRLKTESYYKNCLSRVTTLRQSIERTNSQDLLELSEKCKKAYNGCVYLLGDSKNMAACSEMRFAALVGNMRSEWQLINNVFNRAHQNFAHRLCSCQVQTPASQNELAEWPFNSSPLIPLNASPQPITTAQLQTRGITQADFQENSKKTVAVIGCKWGGGHMEVTRGVCNNLSSLGYHPVSIDLPEILMSEDMVRNSFLTRWLGKDWSTATIFEGLLKEKAFAFINFLRWISSKLSVTGKYSETQLKLVMEHLLKVKPDSVITTYSAHNEVLIKACEMLGIPCIHIATDINNKIETRDCPPAFNLFKMALPFNAPEAVNPVRKTTTESQRIFTGPPVKHEYTVPRNEEDIRRLKQQWGIDINKKIVVISNGKAGAFSPYPELLAKKYANTQPKDIPIHLVVLCGKDNTEFKRHLEQNVRNKTNLPMTIELFTPKMEELMSMASYGGVVIGKAGGTTIFESLTRGTRILVDNVRPYFLFQGFRHFVITCVEMCLRKFGFKRQLPWEKANMEFAKKHGLADVFKDEKDFLPKLERMLNNNNRPVHLNFELKNVETELPKHLRELLVKAEVDLRARRAREIRERL
jgi:UDP-N-acetylglucosamine:LPS N-acetylglucosamine transferase